VIDLAFLEGDNWVLVDYKSDRVGTDADAAEKKLASRYQARLDAYAEAWEQVRVAAGIPEMGSEIDQETMPGATGQVERSVNFTKGCYTGQELVARVDSRTAGAPTRLVLVDGSGEAPVVGAQLWSPDGQVGHLTSTVPVGDGFVALGYRKRSALDLDEAEVRWEGGSTRVRLRTA
jgi:folate-binding protein YgfZ